MHCRAELVAAPARPSDLLALPDSGAGEGVPVQPLPHAQATHRDRARALPHRATDQDLVPEPTHEGTAQLFSFITHSFISPQNVIAKKLNKNRT